MFLRKNSSFLIVMLLSLAVILFYTPNCIGEDVQCFVRHKNDKIMVTVSNTSPETVRVCAIDYVGHPRTVLQCEIKILIDDNWFGLLPDDNEIFLHQNADYPMQTIITNSTISFYLPAYIFPFPWKVGVRYWLDSDSTLAELYTNEKSFDVAWSDQQPPTIFSTGLFFNAALERPVFIDPRYPLWLLHLGGAVGRQAKAYYEGLWTANSETNSEKRMAE